MESAEIVKANPAEIAEQSPAASLLAVIARAAADPNVDVAKMERLLAMQQTIMAKQAETAFMAAMARLTPLLPEIRQNGTIAFGSGANAQSRKYARLEDIDRAIRPLIAEEGFSLSFDTLTTDNGKVRIIGTLSHREGHAELKQVELPVDSSGSKNAVQGVGSTIAYGRRMLCKMFFNLIEKGEDTDGENLKPITQSQADDLRILMGEAGANEQKFLAWLGVAKLEDVLARDHKKAVAALEEKRRNKK